MATRAVRSAAAWTIAFACLGGCATMEPTYHRPAAPTPSVFPQTIAADAAGVSAAGISWRAFVLDPKLRAVVDLALSDSRDLRVAVANVEAARAQYRIQRASLFPAVSASFGAAYGRQSTAGFGGPATTFQERQYSADASVSGYELDLFGRLRSLTHAAFESYLATAEARRASQIAVISATIDADLTLAADQAILASAKDTVRSSSAGLALAQKRLAYGVTSRLDVRQAQTLVDQARADVAADVAGVAQDRDALELVVGAPVPDDLAPAPLGAAVSLRGDVPAGLSSDLLLARPDVVEAEHALKASNSQIGAARAAFFPSITLTGSGGFTSTALSSLFKGASGVWSFAPNVSIPVFAGGANIAGLDYARAEKSVYVARYEKAVQTAFRDVADALARRATIAAQIAADEDQVTAAADYLRLAQARYDRGADAFLNVLTAERTLYAAQQQLSSARLTRAMNLVSLYAALGGGGLVGR